MINNIIKYNIPFDTNITKFLLDYQNDNLQQLLTFKQPYTALLSLDKLSTTRSSIQNKNNNFTPILNNLNNVLATFKALIKEYYPTDISSILDTINTYSKLPSYLVSKFKSQSIPIPMPINTDLLEILHKYHNLLFPSSNSYSPNILFACSNDYTNINSINYHLTKHKMDYNWYAHNYYGENLYNSSNSNKWIIGKDNIIQTYMEVAEFAKKTKTDIIISTSNGLNYNDETHKDLYLQKMDYTQLLLIANSLSNGGRCITRCYGVNINNDNETIESNINYVYELIYNYMQFFKEVAIYKPISSINSNTDFYIIGSGFVANAELLGKLTKFVNNLELNNNNKSIKIPKKVIEELIIYIENLITNTANYYELSNTVIGCNKYSKEYKEKLNCKSMLAKSKNKMDELYSSWCKYSGIN
jgi:hypothetical protein